ncbi:MAG TPA: caspase family protein [Thermoanaerobaculia bacterium]
MLLLLARQARTAGKNGMLIVSIATHGFTAEGENYLITASSLVRHHETSLALSKVFDIATTSDAKRSLIFIDACRKRMMTGSRTTEETISAAPALQALTGVRGHAVFHAAAPGQYAYDDESRGNGVFTAAVIDGLKCAAAVDTEGFVTVESLANFVDTRVAEWVRKHRDRDAPTGIQVTTDSRARLIPVALCSPQKGGKPSYVVTDLGILLDRAQALADQSPVSVRAVENSFHVLNGGGVRLWGGSVDGVIARAELVDLDGDARKEVVIGVTGTGADVGKIIVFEPGGKVRWSRDTNAPVNYNSPRSGRMTIMTFACGDLFRTGTREIVALTLDAQGWFPSRLVVFDRHGEMLSSYWHPGHLHFVLIAAPSSSAAPRIIVGGVNNSLRSYLNESSYVNVLFVLDPKNIAGEAPPFGGQAGIGTHLWYAAIVPSENQLTRLEVVDRDQDGVNEISIWCSTANVFYVTFEGELVSAARGDGATQPADFLLVKRK